jgi:hypothetical protein
MLLVNPLILGPAPVGAFFEAFIPPNSNHIDNHPLHRSHTEAVGVIDTDTLISLVSHVSKSRYSAGWYQPRQNASSQVLLSRMAEMIKPTIE